MAPYMLVLLMHKICFLNLCCSHTYTHLNFDNPLIQKICSQVRGMIIIWSFSIPLVNHRVIISPSTKRFQPFMRRITSLPIPYPYVVDLSSCTFLRVAHICVQIGRFLEQCLIRVSDSCYVDEKKFATIVSPNDHNFRHPPLSRNIKPIVP